MAAEVRVTVEQRGGRAHASTGSPWEPRMGYSRAVRVGQWIAVSGTVGREVDGSYPATVGEQTRRALSVIRVSLEALGGRLEHVIRTRVYAIDITQWEEIAAVHGAVFGDIRPATALLQVSRLIDAEALIEIEVDALVV
jgi:enamine deaminase RidA (YjgF/YER057c/UK114 family)